MVMTHGATIDHRMFNAQVEALSTNYMVLVWDVRGHGLSRPLPKGFRLEDCADDLVAILDCLGAGQAFLAGQSMGWLYFSIRLPAPTRKGAGHGHNRLYKYCLTVCAVGDHGAQGLSAVVWPMALRAFYAYRCPQTLRHTSC